ncbi:IS5 family transposase [Nodosilinea sp. LEGE 07298]|uniref:IS5 family transposase n=1 Tax=Nodosilinea sp. LEGE 07298 TaxID=2777970 RepID=UPI001D144502|nr:IS5 family transposase [Nodosilinea sp. LEGE 07298]
MYRRPSPGQLSFEDFYLPFGGKLSGKNRWVKLAELVPWEAFETSYAEQFSESQGAPAKSFRLALGALIIKERLGTTDAETVEQIRENPYLQYFLGFHEYSDQAPFEASMLSHFRQRLSLELVNQVNARLVEDALAAERATPAVENGEMAAESRDLQTPVEASSDAEPSSSTESEDEDEPPMPPNQGQLIIDASVTPADIHYPTDLHLLNVARASSERILDYLHNAIAQPGMRKPRTYRQQARRAYLKVAKQRRATRQQIRKAIGQQLRYLRRNLGHIRRLVEAGAPLSVLSRFWYRRLLVIQEVYRQQGHLYQHRQRSIEHRIVSLAQPHVRPIVRGKAGTPVEFGAKISISCVLGYCSLDRLDWEAYHEAADLPHQVEQYKARHGYYPESVHADQIYRTRTNRAWCKERGIRLSGPPLGRPKAGAKAEVDRQAQADAKICNAVEGKFGQGKRRFSLGRVMAKVARSAETAIAITFLVMNLERCLQAMTLFFVLILATVVGLKGPRNSARSDWQPLGSLKAA